MAGPPAPSELIAAHGPGIEADEACVAAALFPVPEAKSADAGRNALSSATDTKARASVPNRRGR